MAKEKKKKQSYKLNTEFAAEILSRKKIRPDAPGTQPGDPGNGHVLVIDSEHQMFNGNVYTRRIVQENLVRYKYNANRMTYLLHVEVWKFHNDEPLQNYVVHHDCLLSNGRFNPEENDIEYLFLMKRGEHSFYHSTFFPAVEKICQNPNCRKPFIATNGRMIYCCDECAYEVKESERQKINKFITPEISKMLEEAMKYTDYFFIDAGISENGLAQEVRLCYYCHRPFKTDANRLSIMCARPDCKGRDLIKSLTLHQNYILKQIMERQNPLYSFFRRDFGKLDSIIMDSQPWFLGKRVATMLGYKDTDKAIRDHVKEIDKKLLNYRELIELGIDKDLGSSNPMASKKGGCRRAIFINESGVNELLLYSKLPAAKEIQHQLTHDISPGLRKKGYYSFLAQPSPMTDYFTEEELMMLYLFREYAGGGVNHLAKFNTLTEKQQQVVLQMIDVLHEQNPSHEEPSTIDVEAQQD